MDTPPQKKIWFRAKTHGWGWGGATCWQGWAVYIGYAVSAIAAFPLIYGVLGLWPHRWILSLVVWILSLVVLCVPLFIICRIKGAELRWRWGDDDADSP